MFLAALTSPLVACAPSVPPSYAAIDPGSRLRWGGVTTGVAADLARPGLLGDCIEAGPEGGDRYIEGLDRVIRVGVLGLIGEGEPELTALSGLLSVDAVALEVDTTETLHLAPALADLGDLNIDSPALRFALPRWPIRSLGSLEVAWGGTLLDLDAIGDVEHIDGDVILYRLSQNVDGLQRLEEVEGDLVLSGVLHNTVTSLQRLRRVGGLSFADNDRLEALPALPGLETLEADLLLDHNLGLEQLRGLSALREVGGALQVTGNRSLSLDEIDALIEGLDAAPAGGSTVSGNGR